MLCMATPALASNEEIRRQNIIESILEKYPNADINIGEDGAINVFLPNIQTAAPFSTTVYRLYAPEGGTYTGFYPPSGVLPEESPVFISYMPGETARFFRDVREDKNLFYDILDFYVPYQQMEAIRTWALPNNVYVESVGFPLEWNDINQQGMMTAANYLQEIRSTIQAINRYLGNEV